MMKSTTIRQYAPVVYSCLSCKSHDGQNIVLSQLNDKAFDFVCDCLNKVVYEPSTLDLNPKQIVNLRKKLSGEKKNILYLAKKGGNRVRKRKIIATQSGAGIGLALTTVLPFLVSAIKNLIQRGKKK